jgi:hypothetical protein
MPTLVTGVAVPQVVRPPDDRLITPRISRGGLELCGHFLVNGGGRGSKKPSVWRTLVEALKHWAGWTPPASGRWLMANLPYRTIDTILEEVLGAGLSDDCGG